MEERNTEQRHLWYRSTYLTARLRGWSKNLLKIRSRIIWSIQYLWWNFALWTPQMVLYLLLGRYWLLRGRKEVAFLKWSQVKMCTGAENGEPVEYIEIVQHFDKSCQLNITNTTARSLTDIPPRMYPNPNDPLCPVKFLKFFRTLCCPEQERVLCRPYNTKQMKSWKKKACLTYTTPISLLAKIKLMELIKTLQSLWDLNTGRDVPTIPTVNWASQQLCLTRNRVFNIS